MSSCGKKSMKIKPTSFQKQLSNQHSNLYRFWTQFGPILGGLGGPRWSQVGTKSLQKSIFKLIIKTITFRIALGADVDRLWIPKWSPREGQNFHCSAFLELLGPSWGQDGPSPRQDSSMDRFWSILGSKMAPKRGPQKSIFEVLGALGAILGPSWGQDGPRPLQDSSVDRFWSILEPFLIDFW